MSEQDRESVTTPDPEAGPALDSTPETAKAAQPRQPTASEPEIDEDRQLAGFELLVTDEALDEPVATTEETSETGTSEPEQRLSALSIDWDTTLGLPAADSDTTPTGNVPEPLVSKRWKRRAEALLARAEACSEPRETARLTLVASEIYAKLAEQERALELAREAQRLAPSLQLAGKQCRQIAAQQPDWQTVLEQLDLENRSGATPEARAHAAHLAALIHESQLDDTETAEAKRESANKTLPSDPRTPIGRLIRALVSATGDVQSLTIASTNSPLLSTALQQLRSLRGNPQKAEFGSASPVLKGLLALRTTESWLGRGQPQEAANALLALREISDLRNPVLWLAQALFAQRESTRRDALICLRELAAGQQQLVARVMLARALELRDRSALEEALEDLPELSDAARSALRLLFGQETLLGQETAGPSSRKPSPAESRPFAQASPNEEHELSPGEELSAAGPASDSPADEGLAELNASALPLLERGNLGDGPEGQAIKLGEALVRETRVSTAFSCVPRAITEAIDSALVRVLSAEAAAERGAVDDLLTALDAVPEIASTQGYLKGLFLEALAEVNLAQLDDAREAYASDLQSTSVRTAQADRLLRLTTGDEHQQWLLRLAAESSTPEEAAAWLIEALGHLLLATPPESAAPPTDDRVRDQLLEDAFAAPFAAAIASQTAERLARQRGDGACAAEWRRRFRERTDDRVARAIELVREALAGDAEAERRVAWIDEAVEVKPNNLALNWAREDICLPGPGERGAWREEVAQTLDDDHWPSLLLLEAALDFANSGELELAQHALSQVDEAHAGPVGLAFKQRFFEQLEPEGRAQQLLEAVKSASDPLLATSALTELRELAATADETADTVPWWHAVATRSKNDLHALQRLESAQLLSGDLASVGPLELRIASVLRDQSGLAALFLGVQGRIARGLFNSTEPPLNAYLDSALGSTKELDVEKLAQVPNWILQYLGEHARRNDDAARLAAIELALAEQCESTIDAVTHRVRAGEALAVLGDYRRAADALQTALAELPGHPVAWRVLADVQIGLGARRAAAICLERLAEQVQLAKHASEALTEAGALLAQEGQPEAAEKVLMRAMAIDPDSDEAFGRLYAVYILKGDQAAAYKLADRRLSQLPGQDTPELGVHQARALADLGAQTRAKELLSMTLEANPEHSDALKAFAELCLAQEDWENAEQALLRLSGAAQQPVQQADIYRQLAELYDRHLDNPARAKVCLQEVLKRSPNDTATMRRLVTLQIAAGEGDKAVILYKALLTRIPEAEQTPNDLAELAQLLEEVSGNPKAAHEVLEAALKRWPASAVLIERWIRLYRNVGQIDAAEKIIARSIKEQHSALKTGRLDPERFAALATLYRLQGWDNAAGFVEQLREVTSQATNPVATQSGAQTESETFPQDRWTLLTNPQLEDLTTPSMLSGALRELIRHDAAHFEASMPDPAEPSLELEGLDTFTEYVYRLARRAGLQADVALRAVTSEAAFIDAWRSEPAELVVSNALVDQYHAATEAQDEPAQARIEFLVLRALKALHLRAAALARLSPIQLSTLVPAWLKAHGGDAEPPESEQAPMSQLPGASLPGASLQIRPDAGGASEWLAHLRDTPTTSPRPDLADEALRSLGGRSSQVGTALRYLCNRAALAVTLRPSAALEALKITHVGVSSADNWFLRDPEARDLLIFAAGPSSARVLELEPETPHPDNT